MISVSWPHRSRSLYNLWLELLLNLVSCLFVHFMLEYNSETCLNQTLILHKLTLKKVRIQEIFVNLTCINWTPVYSRRFRFRFRQCFTVVTFTILTKKMLWPWPLGVRSSWWPHFFKWSIPCIYKKLTMQSCFSLLKPFTSSLFFF